MYGIILGLLIGIAAPIQTSVNSSLRIKLKSPYLSSIVSFVVSAIATVVALLITQHSLALPLAAVAREPWWIWTGGLCGTVLVVCLIVSMPYLGSAQTVIIASLGQVLTGLILDNWGMFGSNIVPLNIQRLAGAALVLGGVVTISKNGNPLDKHSSAHEEVANEGGMWLYRILAFVAGVATALQISINGRLGEVTGNLFTSTMISMCIGLSGVVLLSILIRVFKGREALYDDIEGDVPGKWWMYTGGLFGFFVVCGNVVIAPLLGTGIAVVLNTAGQMIGGVGIDAIGFLGIEKQAVTVRKLAGIVLIIAGIALVNGVI